MNPRRAGVRFLAEDTYTPPVEAHDLINLLAWCATACGVAGLIIVGIQMSIQLNRGEPGEGASHFRGFFFVTLGCLVASTAGPLVESLGDLRLLGP
ncbi:hypothetical protein [Streptomyces pseudovenezuelae]|uniref:Uncharacterized protein n=1 Tax=Streptomyces pseudovenezuelae TaxID=67350 RepID=A0ABT6LQD2_9ACTN|nr:hypothetical protein [Streptomyces pseudovenezuelae]MDH6218457.1 hypothetical protein [Streptomyces pseudovenezuelae]